MNVANLYKKIKQILDDSNIALINKGLNSVDNLYDIPIELNRININRLPYALSKQITVITEDDLSGVTTINNNIFQSCRSLISVTIPNSVATIYNDAFYDCTSLSSVTIGDSVTTIGERVFDGCASLTDIYLNPTSPPSLNSSSAIPDTTTIHVPVGSGNAYKSATNWSVHASRIVEDIEV